MIRLVINHWRGGLLIGIGSGIWGWVVEMLYSHIWDKETAYIGALAVTIGCAVFVGIIHELMFFGKEEEQER